MHKAASGKAGHVAHVLRAFRNRNYRLFFFGQAVSLIGTWMQRTALMWLVFRLTGSPFWLGVITFATNAPNFFLAPFSGVIADRTNKKRLLLGTVSFEMVQALVLALLVFTDTVLLWHLVALSIFFGIISSFETPVRQSFVVDMLESKEDLGNAIALNSSIFNVARMIGPAIAGLIIAAWGEAICFLANGLSYFAVIAAMIAMRVPPRQPLPRQANFLKRMREGFAYSARHPSIRNLLVLLGFTSLLTMPYVTLLPVFAANVLGGNAKTLGFLSAAIGSGALLGAILLAARSRMRGISAVINRMAFFFGLCVLAFSLSTNLALSLLLAVLMGFSMMTLVAACNTLLQSIVHDDKRGRVMSHYVMVLIGLGPFGGLFAGWLAEQIGAQWTVGLGGAAMIVLFLVMRKHIKRAERGRLLLMPPA